MKYKIKMLEPATAYLSNWLYLPKRAIPLNSLKSSLTLPVDQTKSITCYEEHPYHLAVPRALITREKVEETMPLEDLRPIFEHVELKSRIELDAIRPEKTVQRDSVSAMYRAPGGILNLSCGTGKTVIAVDLISRLGHPALIVAQLDMVLDQWKEEIIRYIGIENHIGKIQGAPSTWIWKNCPIVLASLTSLARYSHQVPFEIKKYFGTIIWDECHCLAAPMFSRTASLFPGKRYGLTATVERADRLESVFLWHLGPIIHSDLSQDLIPRVTLLPSPTEIDLKDYLVHREIQDRSGNISPTRLVNYVANLPEELNFVEQHLRQALDAGRRILAISWSKDQLTELHSRFPESGLITGDVKGAATRRQALSDHQLCFGIAHLARQALNEKKLDTLFILTEYRNEGMLQQSVGRIQRFLQGKKQPIVVIVEHNRIRPIAHRAKAMVRYFRSQGFEVEIAKRS